MNNDTNKAPLNSVSELSEEEMESVTGGEIGAVKAAWAGALYKIDSEFYAEGVAEFANSSTMDSYY